MPGLPQARATTAKFFSCLTRYLQSLQRYLSNSMMQTYLLKATKLLLLSAVGQALPTAQRTQCSQSTSNPADLLNGVIDAMGGFEALNMTIGLTYESSSIYRSQTLTQNYNLHLSDQTVAEAGTQNISFLFSDGILRQRLDRKYQYGFYWLWAFPDLKPMIDFSLVVQAGPNASACFNKGQNSFFADDPSQALGYADGYLTDYLVQSAQQLALPHLLQQFHTRSSDLTSSCVTVAAGDNKTQVSYSALHDAHFDLTLIIDDDTRLPYAVRVNEDHKVFGPSTSDVVFLNYTVDPAGNGNSLRLPHRVQTVYNQEAVLEDFVIDKIIVNPTFAADLFDASPPPSATGPGSSSSETANAPRTDREYPRSEVHEFFEAGLWGGPFGDMFNVSDVVVQPVFPNGTTPQIMNLYVGYPDYIQLLVEFDDGLLITDAPGHRSKIILDWVAQNMHGKKITHVVPSHHHRDHAGGVADYLSAGAALVIPEVAKEFYQNLPGGPFTVITYNDAAPFVLKDSQVQVSSFWLDESPHARDWSYAVASHGCQISDVVVFNADVVNPGQGPVAKWDTGAARAFLRNAIDRGVPRGATLVGSHGSSEIGLGTQDSLANIADLAGVVYPQMEDDGLWC
ncbi:hypothetical protein LTR84_002315 [Exophiala bonariae]|uniref:Metallo-beta-lactamase domain-containing protein n=1 Tax=Exophiala bonariae TaxID=1690606 RepID=A0AAV9NAZ4_9EURO|nr:hypothetical protein LTR84_002315 [Exophiala bonariae]